MSGVAGMLLSCTSCPSCPGTKNVSVICFCVLCLVLFNGFIFLLILYTARGFVMQGIKSCSHMFGRNGFKRLMEFLIGTTAAGSEMVKVGLFCSFISCCIHKCLVLMHLLNV